MALKSAARIIMLRLLEYLFSSRFSVSGVIGITLAVIMFSRGEYVIGVLSVLTSTLLDAVMILAICFLSQDAEEKRGTLDRCGMSSDTVDKMFK